MIHIANGRKIMKFLSKTNIILAYTHQSLGFATSYHFLSIASSFQGSLVYESIGLYPAQSFFTVNRTTGLITLTQSLKNDGFARDTYTVNLYQKQQQ